MTNFNFENVSTKKYIDFFHRLIKDYNLPIPMFRDRKILENFIDFYSVIFNIDKIIKDAFKINDDTATDTTISDGIIGAFLDEYYQVRNNIIETISGNESYQNFNNNNDRFNQFSEIIKEKSKEITKRQLYITENVGSHFISFDIRRANFTALSFYDKKIVNERDSYEEFVRDFTDNEFIVNSKYFRQVVFGALNPSRQITVEKYMILQLYDKIKEVIKNYDAENVLKPYCVNSDEIIFKYEGDDEYFLNFFKGAISRYVDDKIIKTEVFKLNGYKIAFSDDCFDNDKVFYVKEKSLESKFNNRIYNLPVNYQSFAFGYMLGLDEREVPNYMLLDNITVFSAYIPKVSQLNI